MSMRIQSFVSRGDFIVERCSKKSVLHLGCIGSADQTNEAHLTAMLGNRELHALLREAATAIVGIDNNTAAVRIMQAHGFNEIIVGDVERLEKVSVTDTFDVIVCGHLLQYLSCPGRMLEGIKRFTHPQTELIITVPNALGLLRFTGHISNRMFEGSTWVLAFTPNTLRNLLQRHGYKIIELHTCYNSAPLFDASGIRYVVGIRFFRLWPKAGATLLIVARPVRQDNQ